MRNTLQLLAFGMTFVLCLALVTTPVVSQQRAEDLMAGSVDYRMTSLEQVKKIDGQIRARRGGGETMTVMKRWDGQRSKDRRHLIVGLATATPPYIQNQLRGDRFDSVTWSKRPGIRPLGSCDSDDECEAKTDKMCKDAGHDGVDGDSVAVSTHVDGSKTCSGDCSANGAVAFVTCSPS